MRILAPSRGRRMSAGVGRREVWYRHRASAAGMGDGVERRGLFARSQSAAPRDAAQAQSLQDAKSLDNLVEEVSKGLSDTWATLRASANNVARTATHKANEKGLNIARRQQQREKAKELAEAYKTGQAAVELDDAALFSLLQKYDTRHHPQSSGSGEGGSPLLSVPGEVKAHHRRFSCAAPTPHPSPSLVKRLASPLHRRRAYSHCKDSPENSKDSKESKEN